MLQADQGRVIDYIKDNIDSCLAFANFRFDSIARSGVTEEQYTTRLFDGLFVIFKTRKVTKVLVEMKDGENTERFLRKPSECFKVIDRGSSNA